MSRLLSPDDSVSISCRVCGEGPEKTRGSFMLLELHVKNLALIEQADV